MWLRSTKFRRSPLPQGGLEISIKLRVGKGKAGLEIFRKMKGFVLDNYLESVKIPLDVKAESLESLNVTIFYLNPLYMNKAWISAF